MDTYNFDNPPLFGLEPLWPLDGDSTNSYGTNDLADIAFDLDIDFEHHALLLPSTGSLKSGSPGPQVGPSVFANHSIGFIGNIVITDLWEDMGSTSASQFSLSSMKSETEVFQSKKMESFQMTERQTSAEKQNKRRRLDFRHVCNHKQDDADVVQVKEMIYRSAVMRTVNFGQERPPKKPERRNVKMSREPQTIAARRRRERLSERLRMLQRLVPGGSKMDTANMLHEAANYLKYLKSQLSDMEIPAFLSSMRVDSVWEG